MLFAIADLLLFTLSPVSGCRLSDIFDFSHTPTDRKLQCTLAVLFLWYIFITLTLYVLLEASYGTSRSRNYIRTHCWARSMRGLVGITSAQTSRIKGASYFAMTQMQVYRFIWFDLHCVIVASLALYDATHEELPQCHGYTEWCEPSAHSRSTVNNAYVPIDYTRHFVRHRCRHRWLTTDQVPETPFCQRR